VPPDALYCTTRPPCSAWYFTVRFVEREQLEIQLGYRACARITIVFFYENEHFFKHIFEKKKLQYYVLATVNNTF